MSVSDDLAKLQKWATRIDGRYMGADQAGRYGAGNDVIGELLMRVAVQPVVDRHNVAD